LASSAGMVRSRSAFFIIKYSINMIGDSYNGGHQLNILEEVSSDPV